MIKRIIEKHLTPSQDYIFGFANLDGLLPGEYSEYRFGISIGKKLDESIISSLNCGPTIEYFQHYNDVNRQLTALTSEIHMELLNNDIISLPVVPTISVGAIENRKYLQKLNYDISHKMVATRAGLGWIGKTDLLVTKKFGPRLRLVSILLKDNPGYCGNPVEKSRCGDCNICVERCPAQAANGLKWNVSTHRDAFFDAFKCREMCREVAWQKLNVDERICGLCISVCPVGLRCR